jgi:hypothetical protein
MLTAIALLAVMYVGVVVASRLFADPDIPLDDRLLSPFMLLAEVALVVAFGLAWRGWQNSTRLVAGAIFGAWLFASLWVTVDDARYALETGSDYADIQWRGSPLIAWVRTQAQGRALFTNFPVPLYFHADRVARLLPQDSSPDSASAFTKIVARQNGLIVAFDRTSDYVEKPDTLLAEMPLRRVATFPDGAVWEIRQ